MPKKDKKDVIWNIIKESRVIVLTTHVHPDGDGIASQLALFYVLSSLGKRVYIINQDKTPDMYAWLPDADKILALEEKGPPHLSTIDLAVLIDCSSRDRIGGVYEIIKNSNQIVSIDHHEGSECFRDNCYVDTSVSSVGELLFNFIPDIKQYMDNSLATYLYVSIMTDTGSFAYSNTTKKVFQIASQLIGYGIAPDYIFRMVYNNRSMKHFRLLGKALELLKAEPTGKIVHLLLPLSVYQEIGAVKEDNEGILEVIRGLKNIELVIMLRQLDKNRIKGSLRSTNFVDCHHLSKMFGGGGHFKASGFTVNGDVDRIGNDIVRKICEEVKRLGWI